MSINAVAQTQLTDELKQPHTLDLSKGSIFFFGFRGGLNCSSYDSFNECREGKVIFTRPPFAINYVNVMSLEWKSEASIYSNRYVINCSYQANWNQPNLENVMAATKDIAVGSDEFQYVFTKDISYRSKPTNEQVNEFRLSLEPEYSRQFKIKTELQNPVINPNSVKTIAYTKPLSDCMNLSDDEYYPNWVCRPLHHVKAVEFSVPLSSPYVDLKITCTLGSNSKDLLPPDFSVELINKVLENNITKR